jgi:hypothetical protein
MRVVGKPADTVTKYSSSPVAGLWHYDFVPVRLIGLIAVILLSVLLTANVARAQSPRLVEPGVPVTIVKSENPITDASADKGTVQVLEKVGGGKENQLIYVSDTNAGLNDTVKYTLDGVAQSVSIEVRSGAQNFGSPELYQTSFKALFVLFILAVLVENGLQLVFRWRPYLRTFDTSAVNAIIAFAFSLFFVFVFDLDVVTKLVNAYSDPGRAYGNNTPGFILTAMVIAGGSAGVNRIFRTFGFRPFEPPAELVGPKEDDIAWISVTLNRKQAEGSVNVLYGEKGKEEVIGAISGIDRNNPISSMFLRNKGRYPQSGGYTVKIAQNRCVKLVGIDKKDQKPIEVVWGPYNIGSRAVIDLKLTL